VPCTRNKGPYSSSLRSSRAFGGNVSGVA
jgi:hypothetical protein